MNLVSSDFFFLLLRIPPEIMATIGNFKMIFITSNVEPMLRWYSPKHNPGWTRVEPEFFLILKFEEIETR